MKWRFWPLCDLVFSSFRSQSIAFTCQKLCFERFIAMLLAAQKAAFGRLFGVFSVVFGKKKLGDF